MAAFATSAVEVQPEIKVPTSPATLMLESCGRRLHRLYRTHGRPTTNTLHRLAFCGAACILLLWMTSLRVHPLFGGSYLFTAISPPIGFTASFTTETRSHGEDKRHSTGASRGSREKAGRDDAHPVAGMIAGVIRHLRLLCPLLARVSVSRVSAMGFLRDSVSPW